jgi:D-tyrosyl-tRNA(Tyr) deacylase
MKLVLASKDDPAARNMASRLLELESAESLIASGRVRLVRFSGEATELSRLPEDAEEVIVASRHVAEAGMPSLTVHVPGKIEERRLAIASPGTIWRALRALVSARDELGLPHNVSLEATHHGPCELSVPVTFVEIGSSPEHWSDPRAGEAAARAIIAAVGEGDDLKNALCFGGPHYAPRHTEIALRTNFAPGHIFPKYSSFDGPAIETAVARTAGGVELFILDWKGLSTEQRATCLEAAAKLGVKAVQAGKLLRQPKV